MLFYQNHSYIKEAAKAKAILEAQKESADKIMRNIRNRGKEVHRPKPNTSQNQKNSAILITIGSNDEIYMDGRRIDVRQVKANVLKLLADNPQGTVVVQADKTASADAIIQVMDGARDAGVFDISLAAEPN